jgi:hypothetical protein
MTPTDPLVDEATEAPFEDTFDGSDRKLLDAIKALLALDASGSLVPHGIGGHARKLLNAAAWRLEADGMMFRSLRKKLAESDR